MRNLTKAALIALIFSAQPGFAQQAPVGGQITSQAPGKMSVAQGVQVTALVTAIDKATRTVTLKGPQGNSFDVVASDAVKNFDKIKVNDSSRDLQCRRAARDPRPEPVAALGAL